MNKLTIAGLSLVAAVAVTMPADAAGTTPGSNDSVVMTATGQKQGAFPGDSAGKIRVYHYEFSETATRDAASGLPTGKRKSNPLTLTKALDKSTSFFFNALTTGETLGTVTFTVMGPASGPDGSFGAAGSGDTAKFTIKLTNAQITEDRIVGPTDKDPAAGVPFGGAVEHVTLTYQRVDITAGGGGKTSGDNWQSAI